MSNHTTYVKSMRFHSWLAHTKIFLSLFLITKTGTFVKIMARIILWVEIIINMLHGWVIYFGTFQMILREEKNSFKKIKMLGFFTEMSLSANLFRLGSSIQKHAGSRGPAPTGSAGGRSPPPIKKNFLTKVFFFLKSPETYPK